VLALRWGDIDWERSRFTVRSSKTDHHEGKDRRIVPIFPELLPHLADAFDRAEPGQEFVGTRYRDDGVNLRTHVERIIGRVDCYSGARSVGGPLRNRQERQVALRAWQVYTGSATLGTPAVRPGRLACRSARFRFFNGAGAERRPAETCCACS
jgi:integrase